LVLQLKVTGFRSQVSQVSGLKSHRFQVSGLIEKLKKVAEKA